MRTDLFFLNFAQRGGNFQVAANMDADICQKLRQSYGRIYAHLGLSCRLTIAILLQPSQTVSFLGSPKESELARNPLTDSPIDREYRWPYVIAQLLDPSGLPLGIRSSANREDSRAFSRENNEKL